LESQPKWRREFIRYARRFDVMTEVFLNRYMCSDTCPCLDYNSDQMEDNPHLYYDTILETEMNKYGRTNWNESWSTRNGMYDPMVWTKDRVFGFRSFMQCY